MVNNNKDRKEKERITILVSEERKDRWLEFSKDKNFSTLSKLIRKSVESYIESSFRQSPTTTISKLSHDLKEPLTAIKGFSHLLIENYKDKLDWSALSKIKEVYDQSVILERIIANALIEFQEGSQDYDILLVDDDSSTNKVLIDFFQIKGYNCKDVVSGAGTFKILESHRPKLILLDILLPDINGYEICRKLKSDKNYMDIPIYYITAVPENEVKAMMDETRADGYFLKPFNFPEFEKLFDYI
jgi:CheY-like chemotaxis protein